MIDAAKLLQLFYAYKKTSFANGSILLGTVLFLYVSRFIIFNIPIISIFFEITIVF